jgi:hypothetical protein
MPAMTQSDFSRILSSIDALSSEQMRLLLVELESKIATTGNPPAAGSTNDSAREETAFDVASRAGVIGCIKGTPRSPTDLSTNPKHMEGFGRG